METKKLKVRLHPCNLKALLLLIFVFITPWITFSQTPAYEMEAENGTITGAPGVSVLTEIAGFSGTGYVGRFEAATNKLVMNINVTTADNYKLVLRYSANYGEKTIDLDVNSGGFSQVVLPTTTGFADKEAGSFQLNVGNNAITIKPNWTWFCIDKISFYKVAKHDYSGIVTDLINPAASTGAKNLYSYLLSNFNKKIISGQTDSYYTRIDTITGKNAMLRTWDFTSYTIGYPWAWNNATGSHKFDWVDNGSTKAAIDWYNATNKKGIVGFHWHWCSPSGGTPGNNTFYAEKTTFDIRQAVIVGTNENTAIIRDIDSIASQLKKLEAAGVPVLWRPLHEAGGGWFWWGAKGADPAKQLWDIVYDRITNYHGIKNLIWIWSTPEPTWYPGNNKVDIIGYDSYPGNFNYTVQKSIFDQLFDIVAGKKLITMSENGPIPDVQKCLDQDAPWSFFMSWSDLVSQQNSNQHIIEVYKNANVLTLSGTGILGVSATNLTIAAAGASTKSFKIKSNVDWTITSDQTWLTPNPASGWGDADIILTAAANPNTATRSAIVTISGIGAPAKTINITQDASALGINQLTIDEMLIYPNPCSDIIYFKTDLKNYPVSIFDLNGKMVSNYKITDNQINVGELQKGIYAIYIHDKNKVFVGKFIKQ